MKINFYEICGFGSRFRRMWFVMKLTILAFFFAVMSLSASTYSQNTKLTLDLEEVTLIDVFKQIESQSEFVFLYKSVTINTEQKISVKVEELTVDKILDIVLKNSGIKYEINKKQIIITPDRTIPSINNEKKIKEENPQPQKKNIKGKVTDTNGNPVPGTTVMIKSTTIGTITDGDGNFTLDVPLDTNTLSFSFIGYQSQDIPISNKSSYSIILKEQSVGLEEVVAVGYGTQKKASVVGAISQTNSQELVKASKGANLSDGIQGLMPGVIVLQNSSARGGSRIGESGDQTKILIRGLSTWNSSSPLILIDGIEREMNTIDPQEIESLSVLKDASATAVFGVRGANGVILITSKRGTEGKPKLSFDINYTIESISRLPSPLGSYEALKLRNYAILQTAPFTPDAWSSYVPDQILEYYRTQQYPELYPDTDWQKLQLKNNAWSHKYNMNIKGGTKFVKYFSSIGLISQDDMLKYNPSFTYNRYNFRTNLDFDITKTTRFSVNLQGVYSLQTEPQKLDGGDNESLYMGIYGKPHDVPVPIYSDGVYGNNNGLYERVGANTLMQINSRGTSRQSKSEVNIDLTFTQQLDKLTKGLKFSAKLASDSRSITNGPNTTEGTSMVTKWINPAILDAKPQNALDSAKYIIYFTPDAAAKHGYSYVEEPYTMNNESVVSGSLYRHTYYNASLNYDRRFGPHAVTGLVLGNADESGLGSNFPTRRIEYVARTSYNYDSRYLIELNGSRTGVNKFGPDRRFDNFYSAALGWVLSNEAFFKKKLSAINNLKVRYSYGTVGNDNVNLESAYPYLTIPSLTNNYNLFATTAGTTVNSAYSGNYLGTVGNPDIQWEQSLKNNIGVDFGFFNNLISGTFDYFTEHRTNMLMSSAQRLNADFVGTKNPPANLGETEMKGYEIDVKVMKDFNNFKPWVRMTLTHAVDNVIYREDAGMVPEYQKIAGHQIGQTSMLNQQNIVQNWDQLYIGVLETNKTKFLPGSYRFVDYNGDGVIDGNDSAPVGYPNRPQNTYSASLGASWKNFSFMALFYGTYNVSINYVLNEYFFNSDLIYPTQRDNAWIPELNQTTTATYRAPWLDSRGGNAGTFWLWDGSYLRLKTVELSYQVKTERLKGLNVEGLKLYVSGTNLILWSDLPIDQEAGGSTYPMTKSINFGATIDF